MDDHELLRRYATEGSDEAFREIVRRHLALVYSAALRQVRDPQMAQDVAQLVFANLARKAGSVPATTVLAGWLHRDTRFTALDLLRSEVRRARREQLAAAMNALEADSSPDWERIRPTLDDALDELDPADRDALLLRYFEQRDYARVGDALGASAEAARKRVERALDRLREVLVKRGITTTGGALGAVLATHAIEAVPPSLAAALTAGSAAWAALGGTNWFANLMLMTETKLAVGGVLLAAALATPLLVQQRALANARAERSALLERAQDPATPAAPAGPEARMSEADLSEQRDRADLERLRRETAELRTRLSELAALEQSVAAETAARRPANAARAEVIPVAQARNVGQSTPAALVQTFIWALSNGDTNLVRQLVASDAEPDLEKLLPPAFALLKEELVNTVTSYGCTGFEVQPDQPAENNDHWVNVDPMTTNGPVGQPTAFRIRSTANGWKLVLNAAGMPVTRQAGAQR